MTRPLAVAVERLAAKEPPWLAELRRGALRRHEELPLPDRAAHLWRYTDPARLLPGRREPQLPGAAFGDLPADFADGTYENAAAYALCRDGVMLRSSVDPLLADRGVLLEDLRRAAGRKDDLVRRHLLGLARTCDGVGEKFDQLSAALFAGGTFVHVPPRTRLDRPLRIANRVGGDGLVVSRSVVVVGEGSSLTLVFDLASAEDDGAPLIHETTELYVGPGASLQVVQVQNLGRRAVHAPILRARVGRDATLECVNVALGGSMVKALQTAELAEPGARTAVLGIVFGDGRQHFDHHTFQDHLAPHTTSDLDYRTVGADRARSVYTGRLRITQAGAGCDARQRNHNLLLSETARADAIPELEILTNDVKATHAAAVGPIDPEQVFFCTSRGLSPEEARRTVVLGFLEPTIARIPGENLTARVRKALDERLGAIEAAH